MQKTILVAAASALSCYPTWAADRVDPHTRPIQVDAAKKWNQPQKPVRIYGNTYYVGVAGLSAILIRTDKGLILLDGDLPQSVPLIEANIREIGFRVTDIRMILNSHAHYDHAGGIAALARDSGAVVVASPPGAAALRAGRAVADDPQAGYADSTRDDPAVFPAVSGKIREVSDGEVLHLGGTSITAHLTPGHTPGSTSWTWIDCAAGHCLNVVYADSLNAISAPGFHFIGDGNHADLTERFRKSIQAVSALPCDILLTVHPDQSGMSDKMKQLIAGATTNPFVDPQACANYARQMEGILDARIQEEKAAATR